METGALGTVYPNGAVLLQEGQAAGESLFVIQEGQVEVVKETQGGEVRLAVRGRGEFVGEMEVFEGGAYFATVRALGEVRALRVDRRTLLRQIRQDPATAFQLVQSMAARLRQFSEQVAQLQREIRPGHEPTEARAAAGPGSLTVAQRDDQTEIRMAQPDLTVRVRRAGREAAVVELQGDVTGPAEAALIQAFARASASETRQIVFNFGQLRYMNSSGISLLITLLLRARRQSIQLKAAELSEHYRTIFALTRLDKTIPIYPTEAEALAAAPEQDSQAGRPAGERP